MSTTIPTPAIIVIVLVAALAVTALGAALFNRYNPADQEARYSPSYEQGQYMQQVRARNYGHLKRESLSLRDVESRYTADDASMYYQRHSGYEGV